ncbi:MAG: 5'-nucleotidase C-terminal domain-containing protein [Eubacteriales bacterium]|nr:5'-nucleotidase C-terminal domain-containing protein [Eubacteriales bacterium]
MIIILCQHLAFSYDDSFTVVVNNYRYNGGGNYLNYLNTHGCDIIPNDESRIVYSTQYDMVQGEDLGQARNLLAEYIRQVGTIAPTITSTWKIVDDHTAQFAVLSTTDMHGRVTTNDISTQKEDPNSMERVASAVAQEREAFGDRTLLIDNGDTLQGTLTMQYATSQRADEENPMLLAMTKLGYDAWVMGNHEFNYTPAVRDTQTMLAEKNGIAVLSGNIVLQEDGVDFLGDKSEKGACFYLPYTLKTIDFGEDRSVRVAVIGLSNAANATWDLATNYPNLQFSSPENPEGLLSYEIDQWTTLIKENDLADIIIVSAHSGRSTDDGIEAASLEAQAISGIAASHGVDLLIYGHDHAADMSTVTDADGRSVALINGGGTALTKTVFTVSFDENGRYAGYTLTNDLLKLANFKGDEALGAEMQPWYDETYAWASAPLGTFDKGWNDYAAQTQGKSNTDLVLKQTKLLDLVHKGQIWSSWQSHEDQGIEGATVSICSAVFGQEDGVLSFTPQDGDVISTLDLSKLYRYANNLLCAVDMTPAQLYGWMSATADMLDIRDGQPALGEGVSIYGVDTFYGVDYVFDLTKPLGERVTSATIGGVALTDMTESIRVVLNSYRLSGGYGFYDVTGLTEADCCWTASTNLGADRAPVPTMLGEYVAHMRTVTPDDAVTHGFDSTWSIVTE